MNLEEAKKELIKEKEIVISNLDRYFYITYENKRFEMTQYFNVVLEGIKEKSVFKETIKNIKIHDCGIYEGELTEEKAEEAILDFLNVYSNYEIEISEILG